MRKKLMIAVPVDVVGGIESHLVEWMFGTSVEGWSLVQAVCRDRPVVSSRNRLVKRFLESDCDVLLSVDSDQIPFLGKGDRTGGLDRLLTHIQRDDVDCVNIITLRITDEGPAPVINKITGPHSCEMYAEILSQERGLHELRHIEEKDGVEETRYGAVGGAGLMVTREALEKIRDAGHMWFKDVFVEEPGRVFCERSGNDLFGERIIGHDIWFFMRMHELGLRCWVDTSLFWGHVKPSDLRAEFRREMQLVEQAEYARHAPTEIARILVDNWGNPDYVAPPEFIARMVEEVAKLPKDQMVVECGSGLTSTILSRMLAKDRLLILEDKEEWFKAIHGKVNGSLTWAPLEDRGEYEWYRKPKKFPKPIGLIVCDGPRADAKGGRYGALPELLPYCAKKFKVLLDDVHRKYEHDTMKAWEKEFDTRSRPYRVASTDQEGNQRGFAVIEGYNSGA